MFKVNNKDTRMAPRASVSIVKLEQVNYGWVITTILHCFCNMLLLKSGKVYVSGHSQN